MTSVPSISAAAMARIDRIMLDDLGIEPLQLMELAGHAVATFARARLLDGDVTDRRVVALAGNGGNGGDAIVAARLLTAWGASVSIMTTRPAGEHTGLAARQLGMATRWGIPIQVGDPAASPLPDADLIVDGLLGFSLQGNPRGVTASLIDAANVSSRPILAIDMPSGLDATTGVVSTPCIRARSTLTLAIAKSGLLAADAASVVGDLWIADIGVPAGAYARLGVPGPGPVFARESFVPASGSGGIP